MSRRVLLLLVALSLTLVPLWRPVADAHAHEAMMMAGAHAEHDHCDQPAGKQTLPAADCAACPCAVGMMATAPVAPAVPVVFSGGVATATSDLAPRGRDAIPPPRPPRA
ncbi:MAG: hypothetical protein ACM3Q1_05635 [Bacteroidales bacterium]